MQSALLVMVQMPPSGSTPVTGESLIMKTTWQSVTVKKMSSFLAEKMFPLLKLKMLFSDILKLMRSLSLVFPMKSGEN